MPGLWNTCWFAVWLHWRRDGYTCVCRVVAVFLGRAFCLDCCHLLVEESPLAVFFGWALFLFSRAHSFSSQSWIPESTRKDYLTPHFAPF